ncbi:MAG: hypothetical protein ABI702_20250 [Burkholderiales bacterium]
MTADDGTFEIADVQPGRYILAALTPGSPPVFHRQSGAGSLVSGDPLSIAAGQRVEGLELRVVRGGVIAGRAVDPVGDRR